MKVLIGNILESNAQTLINTVNCVGVMGKGIALEFKKRFPEMFHDYVQRCKRNELQPGVPYLYKTLFPPQVVNFPTKDHWRAASRIEDVERGLGIIQKKSGEWGIESLAIPPLGCGNGQLLWTSVGPLIYRFLSHLDLPVELYAPYGTPPNQLTDRFLSEHDQELFASSGRKILHKIEPEWVVLVEIVNRIEQEKYHLPVGRTIFQKIAFVATEEGLPTSLVFERGSYGPYCRELDEVKKRLADAGILQEQQLGRMFQVSSGLAYPKATKKFARALKQWEGLIDKTTDLFLRMDTDQAEITASVLLAERELRSNPDATEKDVYETVLKWKARRHPPLDDSEVAETVRNLSILKWLKVKPSSELLPA